METPVFLFVWEKGEEEGQKGRSLLERGFHLHKKTQLIWPPILRKVGRLLSHRPYMVWLTRGDRNLVGQTIYTNNVPYNLTPHNNCMGYPSLCQFTGHF